jgi:hypothetical protein
VWNIHSHGFMTYIEMNALFPADILDELAFGPLPVPVSTHHYPRLKISDSKSQFSVLRESCRIDILEKYDTFCR